MADTSTSSESKTRVAGAAAIDISPQFPVALYGYPNVPRVSTGVHDPLLATALYLNDAVRPLLLISVDIIWLSKVQVARIRGRIAYATGVQPSHILISATHTHSGPSTVSLLSNSHDQTVPPPDERIVARIESGILAAAEQAYRNAVPAEIGFAEADVPGIGGNRHCPTGPAMPTVPVLAIRETGKESRLLAIFYIFSVHPTVLHEDSTLISGDFPGLARQNILQQLESSNPGLHVLHHLGAAGDQSPRHVTRSNTFNEAERLGQILGTAVCNALSRIEYVRNWSSSFTATMVEFPVRSLPTSDEASQNLVAAQKRFATLQAEGAPRASIRTAECDVFGAEEVSALVALAASGRLNSAARECLPAEIQAIRLGENWLIAWPGEVFVEFARRVREEFPRAWIITLANGELQGYLTSSEAAKNNWYEAANSTFQNPISGDLLVEATLKLLRAAC